MDEYTKQRIRNVEKAIADCTEDIDKYRATGDGAMRECAETCLASWCGELLDLKRANNDIS